MKIYYAHAKLIYGKPQETRDISTLKVLGFDVLNPNEEQYQHGCVLHPEYETNPMRYWEELMESCDAVAFRALPGGSIAKGVGTEVKRALELGMPVIELPSFCLREFVGLEDTRQYFREAGQR